MVTDGALSFMARFGGSLIENGVSILPIMPGHKKPGKFSGGEWRDYADWSRHCDRPTKEFEHDIWRRWPDCAVGIACGRLVGIDIDVMDPLLAIRIERLAREKLGDTPVLRIGRAPKRLLVYRAFQPFPGRKKHPIEILARGQQFVAYAIHPDTGRPYEWPEETLLDTDISRLPEITEEQALAFQDAAYAMVPEELRPKTLDACGTVLSEWRSPAEPRGTREAVEAALAFIPNDDLSGSEWVKIGTALKAALGEEGRDLWLTWSKSSNKSGASGKPDTAEKRWAGFRPHSIGAGTIYKHAMDRGWIPEPWMILNGLVAEQAQQPDPAADFISKVQASAEKPRKAKAKDRDSENGPPVAPELLNVPGVLKLFMDHCRRTAMSPQPFLDLAAGIALVGVLAGRKYRTRTDLRSNVYAIGVADSGGGKDHARKQISRCLYAAGLKEYMGGSDLSSGSGLRAALTRQPAVLFQIDEFGDWLREVLGQKAATHRKQIAAMLKELYSKANEIWLGTEYADQSERTGRPRADVIQPHACLYATTTPGQLWKAIGEANMHDGLMARMLMFVSPCSYPDPVDPELAEPGEDLIAALQAVAGGPDDPEAGNLSSIASNPAPRPYMVPETPEATEAYRAMTREQLARQRKAEGTYVTSIAGRLSENAMKLALIRSVSRDPQHPVIEAEDVLWGKAVVSHCIDTLLREAGSNMAETEHERHVKRALGIIQRHGPITERDIMRLGFVLTKRERNDALTTLLEMGAIRSTRVPPGPKGGPPTTKYEANDAGETSGEDQ